MRGVYPLRGIHFLEDLAQQGISRGDDFPNAALQIGRLRGLLLAPPASQLNLRGQNDADGIANGRRQEKHTMRIPAATSAEPANGVSPIMSIDRCRMDHHYALQRSLGKPPKTELPHPLQARADRGRGKTFLVPVPAGSPSEV